VGEEEEEEEEEGREREPKSHDLEFDEQEEVGEVEEVVRVEVEGMEGSGSIKVIFVPREEGTCATIVAFESSSDLVGPRHLTTTCIFPSPLMVGVGGRVVEEEEEERVVVVVVD